VAAFGFRGTNKSPEQLEALERVKVWTRERFCIPDEAPVLVSELACAIPGCVPLETVIAFWTEDAERHHFKVFKPVQAVAPEDLPAIWLDDSLFAMEGGCDCCAR
jgi:nitrate reductase delta subunit